MTDPVVNPFDQFDGQPDSGILKEAPRPGLAERFMINMEAATRQGTITGALRDASTDSRQQDRHRFDSRLESFPEWEGGLEGTAALAGQIAGTIIDAERGTPHLENFVPIGLGEKAVALSGRGLASLRARLFAGAVDAAAVNAVTDAAIQGVEMDAGFRDEFDPIQFASSVGLGATVGGLAGPLTHRPKATSAMVDEIEQGAARADPVRNADLLDDAVRSDPQMAPKMSLDTPEGSRIDFSDPMPPSEAKRALMESEGDLADIALGDRLQPSAQRPDVQAMAIDDAPKPNNGKWSLDDPDIIGEGDFGPQVDIDAHGKDWGKVSARLAEMETGEAPRALDHPDIGDIDVIWGEFDPSKPKGGFGLAKIVAKHPEVMENLPSIIRNSRLYSKTDQKARFVQDDFISVIGLNWHRESKTWLLTAYEDAEGASKARSQRLDDTVLRDKGLQEDASSSSLTDDIIRSGEREGKESRRIEGTTGRSDGHQMDTSSTSSANQDMRLPDEKGKGELDDVIAKIDAETDEALQQARVSRMSGELTRSKDGVARSEKAAAHQKKGKRLVEISNALVKLTGVAAVRKGIKRPLGKSKAGIQGTHHTRTGVIRLKDPEDFPVLAHEVGHHIDARLGAEFSDLMVIYRSELEGMAPKHYARNLWLSEGFAEFFRTYLINPNFAAKHAPRFNKEFTKYLADHKPDWLKGLVEMQDTYRDWISMSSSEAVSSSVVTSKRLSWMDAAAESVKKDGIGNTIGDHFDEAYTNFVDGKHPIQMAVQELTRIFHENTGHKLDLKVKDDPYKLARMLEGAQSAGQMDLLYGVHGYHSLDPEGPSLRDAIIHAQGASNSLSHFDPAITQDFGTYLWARRALGEWDRFEAGDIPNRPDKNTKGDHQVVIREMEEAHPQFRQAADMVYAWNKQLWRKKLDAGLISVEQYMDGLAIRDYVPGLRKQDYPGNTKMEGKGARSGKQNQVNRFSGSNLDVINPLESLMMDAYETSISIAHNDMIKSLKRLGDLAGHGSGRIVEDIPAKEMRATILDPIEVVEAAAKEQGYSKADFTVVRDALEATIGDTKARIFRPEVIEQKGQPIVFYRDGGQLKALRLADGALGQQMMRTFQMMNKTEQTILTNMLASTATIMRTGVTAAPEFIAANIIRDQVMSWVYYGDAFKRVKATATGGLDEIFARDAARKYNLMGGIMGGENVASLRDGALNRDLRALEKKGYSVHKLKSLKGLMSLTEISETSTRIGLYKTFFDEAKLRGLDDFEAAMEAGYLSRDHIDFDRRGLQMVAWARIIPFLNASIQGFDKTTRHMFGPLAKKMMGKVLTQEEERALPQAVKAWQRLGGLTIAGMGIHALMSRYDDYHEISETTRATHWMIKTGDRWTAVPKPFEMAVALNIGEAVFDSVIYSDPIAYERYMDGLFDVLLPPGFTANPVIRTAFEKFGNKDTFTEGPVVPDALLGVEAKLQYTARTSEIAKRFGAITGMSPIWTEKMIVNFTGSLGRSALSLYDAFGSNKPGQSLDDMAILRRFIKSASKGSRSIRKFWGLVAPSTGEFEGAAKSYDAFLDAGDNAAAADYLSGLSEEKRVYLVSRHLEGKAARTKKLHPLDRARRVVRAISNLRKDLVDDTVEGTDGPTAKISRKDRGTINDILELIAVKEARNALVLINQPGWQHRGLMDIEGHYRELEAVNPAVLEVLADRYASGNVIPWKTVQEVWPDYRKRLLEDGSDAPLHDLVAISGQGTELAGQKIKRKAKPVIPGTVQ